MILFGEAQGMDMPRLIRDTCVTVGTLVLCAASNVDAAPNHRPEAYLSAKPILLEVRYCECAAIDLNSLSSALLPDFLDTSKLLEVGVGEEDKGFVSSEGFSMGYAIERIEGPPARFLFNYSAEYTINTDTNSGHGELLVNEGQWVYLFGSNHTTNSGSESTGVAVRVTKHKP